MSSIPRQQHRQLPHNTPVTTSRNNILCHVTRDTLQLAHYNRRQLRALMSVSTRFRLGPNTHISWMIAITFPFSIRYFWRSVCNSNYPDPCCCSIQAIIYDLQQAHSGIMKRLNWSWQTGGWGREKHYGTISFTCYTLPIAIAFDQPRSDKFKKGKFKSIYSLTSLITFITVIGHIHNRGGGGVIRTRDKLPHVIRAQVSSYIVYGSRAEFIGINIFIIIKEQQCIETTF